MSTRPAVLLALAACTLLAPLVSTRGHAQATEAVGQFSGQLDMGVITHAGSARYDPQAATYTVAGSGDNTWFKADDLHYVWKKVDGGDVTLSARIDFVGSTGNAHRKAMLMIRQSLAPESAYVDVARHGDGLTSLQYRGSTSDVTREIETNASAPPMVRIAKHGDYFYVSYARADGKWVNSGAAMKLPMTGPFYVGLAVCSHDKQVIEKAVFSKVNLVATPPGAAATARLYSTLEVVPIASTDRRVVYSAPEHFEAPNWLHDISGYLINEDGHLARINTTGGMPQHGVTPVPGSAPVPLATGSAVQCNNDHGLSADGTQVAFSDSTVPGGSRVYTMPLSGGQPKRITADAPSYWHGWSPDGRTIAFTGQRKGDFDIYTIPAGGGAETRLTTAKGLDDGPEYSPDGKYLYFNSERTGHMQVWRMLADGSMQEQVTHDETNDWFPHLSPDGKWMVFVAYEAGVTGHPANRDVMLQLMSLTDGKVTPLARVFGGQGTMNVPSWSPDSTHVAFVSYAMVPREQGDE